MCPVQNNNKMPSKFLQLNDVAWIYRKYVTERLSTYKIASIVGCHQGTVATALRCCGIHVRNLSESRTGSLNHNYGKEFSSETRGKMSDAHIGLSSGEKHPYYGMNHPEEVREKIRVKRRLQRFPSHHTKPELQFENICAKYNLPFRYTGDSTLWIGKGSRKLNPDFTSTDNTKTVVEVFGDFWHDPIINPNVHETATYEYRDKHFREAGYQMIVFWETDLKREDAEAFVLATLEKVGFSVPR